MKSLSPLELQLKRILIAAERRRQWIVDCGAPTEIIDLFTTYIGRLQTLQKKDLTIISRGIQEAGQRLVEGLDNVYAKLTDDETDAAAMLFQAFH
jgi:hypothetical protein